jgi:nanoRNase/pAp phosphatase (c-di-AMP/oligoRNAs hydrolase)
MKKYLEQRGDKYVTQRFPTGSFNKNNPTSNYSAMLRRISKIGTDVAYTVDFLKENEDPIAETIESAISTLEVKLQIMRDSIQHSSKLKMELGDALSDISMVDMTKGTFQNISYSHTDRGLVLNSTISKQAK